MQQFPLRLADLKLLLAQARIEARASEVIQRLEWIVYFLENGQSLETTAEHFGVSAATIRRWMKRFNPADISSLEERSHTAMRFRSSTVAPEVTQWIRQYRMSNPLIGKERIAELLTSEHNVTVSPSTIGRVIEREKFYFADTPLHLRKRFVSNAEPAVQQPAPVIAPEPKPLAPEVPQQLIQSKGEYLHVSIQWKVIRKAFLMGSLVANVALLFLLLSAVLFEAHKSAIPTEASILRSTTPQHGPLVPDAPAASPPVSKQL